MIKINLLEISREKEVKGFEAAAPPVSSILIAGIIILIASIMVSFFWWYQVKSDYNKLHSDLISARKEKEELAKYIADVKKYEEKKNLWAAKRDAIDQLRKNRNLPVHILDEITKSLPEFLWLDELSFNGDNISFKGHCSNKLDPSTFVLNLENSKFFAEVALNSVKLESSEGGETYSFAITAKITNPFQEIKSAS